jgi:CII-binding regulator of phage lambda lysogenization HflD
VFTSSSCDLDLNQHAFGGTGKRSKYVISLLLELESKLKLQKIYMNKITTTMQVFKQNKLHYFEELASSLNFIIN